MTADRPVVLVVGAASRDITTADPRGWRLGGAVTYASLALARLGLDVRALVGVDAEARRAAELDDLARTGVTLAFADLASGPVFENVETTQGRRQRCLSIADPVPLTSVPRAWTTGHDALLLGPVAGELGGEWAAVAPPRPAPVALGWQGLLRELAAGEDVRRVSPRRSALVDAATLVACSRDDVPTGTNPAALTPLLARGAALLFTEGETGGRLISEGSIRRYDAIPSDATVDPTGAGDVFLGTMLACLLVPALGDPLRLAAAAASLTIEAPGLEGVPDLAAVRRRLTRPPSLASRSPSATSSRGSGRPSQA